MIPATAISAPPPRSAICAAADTGGPLASPLRPRIPFKPEVVDVVPGPIPVRAVLPVARDRAVHEPRVLGAQALVSDPEPVEHSRPERLEQDVGVADEANQHFLAARRLQVHPDRALSPVERQEQRAAGTPLGALVIRWRPANVVAESGVLDLDHVRAEVCKQQRAEPARKQPREVEHPEAGERGHAGASTGIASRSRASSTVAGRRPASSVICRALAIRSPLERAMAPSGR